jgi:iron complex outermembrane receptor protein
MIKADVFHSRDDFIDRRDGEWTGVGLQGRYRRRVAPGSELQVQSYYRREYRNIANQLTHSLDTVDLDLQHAVKLGRRNNLIWGSAVRVNSDTTHGSSVIHFEPASRTYPLFSGFAQDELTLRPDSVTLTAGLKVEHNVFSGADWQPNLRARWTLPRNQVLWAAVARAVRRPTRFDDDIVVTNPTGLAFIRGSDDFESEAMTGWEVGHRLQPLSLFSLDTTLFRQHYARLRSQEAPATGLVPLTLGNTLRGASNGVEIAANLQPSGWWRMHVAYTYLDTDISRAPGSLDVSGGVSEANDPHHLFMVRTSFDLARNVDADAWLRGVGSLPSPAVPAFTELNARVGWRFKPRFELALVGQDLLHARHPEGGTPGPRRSEFQRSVRVSLTARLPQRD